jgi:hypothetical protein
MTAACIQLSRHNSALMKDTGRFTNGSLGPHSFAGIDFEFRVDESFVSLSLKLNGRQRT